MDSEKTIFDENKKEEREKVSKKDRSFFFLKINKIEVLLLEELRDLVFYVVL